MTSNSSPLTSGHVMDVFFRCLASAETDGVTIDGVVNRCALSPGSIDACRDEIRDMLAELPGQFFADQGGGWSFLNACNDRHGRQWTSYHQVMEQLFMLGMAAKMVEPLFPREDWSLLPGQVPYYIVKIS